MTFLLYTLLMLGILATVPVWLPLGAALLMVGFGVFLTVGILVLVLAVAVGMTFPIVILALALAGVAAVFALTPKGREALKVVGIGVEVKRIVATKKAKVTKGK